MAHRREPSSWPGAKASLTAAVFASLVVSTTASARAQSADCAAAADEARTERAAGKLLRAREHFLSCAERCSTEAADPCGAAADELVHVLPSIVVEAHDAEGREVTDVSVTIDGVMVTQELDGKAFAVDPGPHNVSLVRRGVVESASIAATEGVKGQRLRVTFHGTRDPDGLARDATGHAVWPWAIVAVGGAILVGGIAVVLTAPSLPGGCDRSSRTCTPTASETAQAFHQRQEQAGQSADQPIVGGITIAAGAAVAIGALVWHFTESTEPRMARLKRLAPWFAREGGGGLAASGTF